MKFADADVNPQTAYELGRHDEKIAQRELYKALVQALLAVEWEGGHFDGHQACPECVRSLHGYKTVEHESGCALDAALTAAGLKTQEERDAAREMIRLSST